MNYVGIDHHRQYSHMTLMDQEGQVLRSSRVPNLRSESDDHLLAVPPLSLRNFFMLLALCPRQGQLIP